MSDLSTQANNDQARASDPGVSAWVSANAGSGKTHVLVNRVIRLMLTGTPPEKILCLTYTRAAAAEMSNRLYERLAEWIPLDDEALIDKIHKNTGHGRFTTEELAAPRRLFARALETPGGLKIQTIHAFCDQLLHRFPLEAGVTSGFSVMDDRQAQELLAKVRADFFALSEKKGNGQLRDGLSDVIKFSGSQKIFNELLEKLLDSRDELTPVYRDMDAASTRLAAALNIAPHETAETVSAMARDCLDRPALKQAWAVLEGQPTKTDRAQAIQLGKILAARTDGEIFELLKSLTHSPKGTLKADSGLCTKKCAANHPDVLATMQGLADCAVELIDKIKAIDVLHATIAALQIGKIITASYQAEKNRLGVYDYHDLIGKVLAMFAQMPDAAWVLYKLDGGLDHILIDEAQDTSPAQWDIIQFLADDFFSGAGARAETPRSIFAVGDRKQSIYSFQGADPASFDLRKQYFQQVVRQSGQKFVPVDFEVSFRSTTPVLELVDQVFEQPEAAKGVDKTVHSAQRKNAPGLVELWPMEEKSPSEKRSAWVPETGAEIDAPAQVRLAQKIAQKIASWLELGQILESKNRPIRPGDILILVRKRTRLMAALVRALKLADVRVAGVDRLKLTRDIAIQDLMALARFVLTPRDDLNFAGLLKSSLLKKNGSAPFDDDDLILVAAQRGGRSVWSAFLNVAETNGAYWQAKDDLARWQGRAETMLPFEFFSNVLNTDNKRKIMLERLGSEASEPIDAFLELAQEYEKNNVATLQGFLSWVETGDTEIKREMEKSDNEVRIMTVHGAKGLEADIVILPDTFELPDGKNIPKILNFDQTTPVWRLKSALETRTVNKLKQQYLDDGREELNRLLYVAMTRACDRLYIGAAEPKKGQLQPDSWYQLVHNVLGKAEYLTPDPVFGQVWQISGNQGAEAPAHKESGTDKKSTPLPDWIAKIPPVGKPATEWTAPSRIGLDGAENNEVFVSPLTAQTSNRFLRGNLIHKMLQYLPDITPARRKTTAERYIASHGGDLTDEDQTATLSEIMAILEDGKFAAVFAPGSMAEAPVVARIKTNTGQELTLNGQIDRLCITDNEILIIDYKTNRPPPASENSVNPQYIAQLAAYRLALLKIYPDRPVRAGLLWTHSGFLMEIDEKLLEAAFSD